MAVDNWVVIYTTGFEYKAEIIRQILEENDIASVILNKKDSSYSFGEVEVHVKQSNILRAKQIINNSEI